jgi:uncharacterized protein YggE
MTAPRVPSLVALLAAVLAAGLVAVGVAGALTAGSASAEVEGEDGPDAGVRVAGVGTASARPDVLRFRVGVEVTAETVDAALASANAAAARVLSALEERGVADRDVQTASVEVHPRYDAKGQEITGYVVRQDLSVAVHELDTAGATISAAVAAGGNAARLSGVQFVLEDDTAVLAEARDEAYAAARAKAEQYAGLAGRELGAVLAIREDVDQSSPQPYLAEAESRAAAPVPLAPGSAEVSVRVDVRWALR